MKPTVSIYVDAQNLYHAARAAGDLVGMDLARPDYEGILTEAIQASADLLGCDEWKQVEVLHQLSRKHISKSRLFGISC